MVAPAQRGAGKNLSAGFRIGKRIAADPWLAALHDDSADLVELRLAAVAQRRLQILPGAELHDVGRGRRELQTTTHGLDLLVLDRLQQIAHEIDIFGADEITALELASDRKSVV